MEPTESWTERPTPPDDPYRYYVPDDQPNACQLAGPPAEEPGIVPVFSDEFSDAEVDAERWNVASTYIGFASSLNDSKPANARVHDGSLFFVSDRNAAQADHPYVSAALDTRGKFARTYGRLDVRARFDETRGVWYALVGRPWTGDYPIVRVEIVNRATSDHAQVYLTHEWDSTAVPDADRRQATLVDDLDVTQFHVYTILWRPDSIDWLIDGVTKLHSSEHGVPSVPAYWTMGGWVGGWPGEPPESAQLPASFEIDYFRISRVDGVMGEPALVVSNPKSSYFRKEALELQLANFDEACTHVDVYEGAWRLAQRATSPFSLSLQKISHGDHTFTFVARDGKREAQTTFDFHVN